MSMSWESEFYQRSLYPYIFYILLTLGVTGVFGNEFSVYKAITTDYDKNVRPVSSANKTMTISLELTYFLLLSMDQKEETITFMTELETIWTDEFAVWNASQYGDTSSVLIPADLLWKPDIVVSTGLSVDYMMPEDQRYISVMSNGTVRSSSPCVIRNQCRISIEKFPYDIQTCNVTLGSWMYTASQIDLIIGHKLRNPNASIVDDTYKGNGEWTLLSFDSYVTYSYDDGEFYAEVKYIIRLKRQPIYYICVLLLPTFLTATVCLLGLFVPAMNTGERIEKVNMGLSTLLSMAVILSVVADQMPKTTTLPLLGFYVLAELIICTIGVGFSMLLMVAHQRVGTRAVTPPRWINAIVLFKTKSLGKSPTAVTKVYPESGLLPTSKDEKTSVEFENIKNSIYAKRLNQALDNVEEYIDDKEFEDYILLQWIIIFDRIDTFLLILFNIVNIFMSAILLFE